MHIDDHVIQRFVDGELSPAEARSVHDHVSECRTCRSRIDLARHEDATMHELLEWLDHPVPALSAARTIAVSRAGRASTWWRAAMVPLLVVGAAGAAYALPGSPVRTWIEDLFGGAPVADSATANAGVSSPALESTGGLAVEPGRALIVSIEDAPAAGTIEARLHDGALVEVTAHGGTSAFGSDEGRIVIRGGDPGTRFIVRIPRDAMRVEIRVDARIVFLKTGTTVSASRDAGNGDVWTIPVDAPAVGGRR